MLHGCRLILCEDNINRLAKEGYRNVKGVIFVYLICKLLSYKKPSNIIV